MYTVMGITGQIGGVVGHALLAANQQVRAVVRDADKGRAWADRGCEVALATIEDATSLTTAFRGAEGVFVLVPSSFDPASGLSRGPDDRCNSASRTGSGVSGASRLPLYDWGASHPVQPSDPAYNHRGGSRHFAHADYLSAARMVHGELQLGRGSGARAGRDSKFPATARQAGGDGGNCGHWQGGRQTASGKLDRSPSGGTRRTATRDAKRDCGHLCRDLAATSAHGSGAPRVVGEIVHGAGDEESDPAPANAGRFQ